MLRYFLRTVRIFLCPSDPYGAVAQSGPNSYRANMGICELCAEQGTGSFWTGRPGTLAGITDGLANTLAFSEKAIGSPWGGPYSAFRDWVPYVGVPVPNSGDQWLAACSRIANADNAQFDAGKSWLLYGGVYSWFYVSASPNSRVADCGLRHAGGTGIFAARSYHPGGVNASMADGSVRWYTSGTAPAVWRGLGTRSGGEIASQTDQELKLGEFTNPQPCVPLLSFSPFKEMAHALSSSKKLGASCLFVTVSPAALAVAMMGLPDQRALGQNYTCFPSHGGGACNQCHGCPMTSGVTTVPGPRREPVSITWAAASTG